MDKIVAQYSRPSYQNVYSEQDQQDLTESLPPLSLKFALPPVANVSYSNTDKVIHRLEASCHEHGETGQASGGPQTPSSQRCGEPSSQQNESIENQRNNHF